MWTAQMICWRRAGVGASLLETLGEAQPSVLLADLTSSSLPVFVFLSSDEALWYWCLRFLSNGVIKKLFYWKGGRAAQIWTDVCDSCTRWIWVCGKPPRAHPSVVICVSVHLNKVIPPSFFYPLECSCSCALLLCHAGHPDYDLFGFQI